MAKIAETMIYKGHINFKERNTSLYMLYVPTS